MRLMNEFHEISPSCMWINIEQWPKLITSPDSHRIEVADAGNQVNLMKQFECRLERAHLCVCECSSNVLFSVVVMNVIDFIVLFAFLATLNVNSIFSCSNWTVGWMNKKQDSNGSMNNVAACIGHSMAQRVVTHLNFAKYKFICWTHSSTFVFLCCDMRFLFNCRLLISLERIFDLIHLRLDWNSVDDKDLPRGLALLCHMTKWACTFLSLTLSRTRLHCCWMKSVEFGSLFRMFSFQITF